MFSSLLIGALIGGIGACGKMAVDTMFKKEVKEEEVELSYSKIPRKTWEDIFYYNKVFVQEDKDTIFTPYLLEEYEIENGAKYFFKIPIGLVSSDLIKCETQIKEMFNAGDVKIYHYKQNTAMIEVYGKSSDKGEIQWEEIWKACKVYTGDRSGYTMPKVTDCKKDMLGNDLYTIVAPLGISLADFNKVKDYLKDYFQAKEIKFESLGAGKFQMDIIRNKIEEKSSHSNWDRFWFEIKIYSGDEKVGYTVPQFLGEEDIIGGKRYTFKMPIGKSTHDVKSKDTAIKEFLDAESIKINPSNKKNIEIDAIYETLPKIVQYTKVPRQSKDTLEIVFGRRVGDWIRIKLDSGENGILINGMAGSGKSNLFKGMILDLALHFSPDMLKMYLVDFKIVELAPFRKLKHVVKYLTEEEEVAELIDDLTLEMSRRYKLFDKLGVENIYSYNKKVSKEERLPFILFAIEEISKLTTSDIGVEGGYNKKLSQLNYRSRACGFMNLFCVQRMTNANIPREVSNSLGVRPSLRVADSKESELIVGSRNIDLSTIKQKGQGCLIVGGQGEMFQGFKIEHEDIKNILEEHNLLK